LCQSILARVKKAGIEKQKYEKISEKKMPIPIEALKWLDIYLSILPVSLCCFLFPGVPLGPYLSGHNL
jgi:hypothetical protein